MDAGVASEVVFISFVSYPILGAKSPYLVCDIQFDDIIRHVLESIVQRDVGCPCCFSMLVAVKEVSALLWVFVFLFRGVVIPLVVSRCLDYLLSEADVHWGSQFLPLLLRAIESSACFQAGLIMGDPIVFPLGRARRRP
ncbi:hypothetical protein NDU88_004384 [Pleurodeles waltl]|uniref:Uncharacterized protein n=1 Tax=Pleurodeles waltl TaxID=8319 RepID=A0AAV7VJP4_PLEWA|nr:hypothetical protein NDU88_004384 [Pleurodeles waltl]